MNGPLYDRRLIRRFRQATGRRLERRRLPLFDRPWIWRGALSAIVLGLGAGLLHQPDLLVSLWTVVGLVATFGRVQLIWNNLYDDGDLAVLATLPTARWRICDYQLRPVWTTVVWTAAEGLVLALMVSMAEPLPLLLVLVGAVAHMLLSLAMALWLHGWRFFSPIFGYGLAIWGILACSNAFKDEPHPWLDWFHSLAAYSPWGGLAQLLLRHGDGPLLVGSALALLAGLAWVAILAGRHRLRMTWTIPEPWLSVVGCPRARGLDPTRFDQRTDGNDPPGPGTKEEEVAPEETPQALWGLWQEALPGPPGSCLRSPGRLPLGWPGAIAHAVLNEWRRHLADCLQPDGLSNRSWAGLVVVAAAPVLARWSGVDAVWVFLPLIGWQWLVRHRTRAWLLAALYLAGWLWSSSQAFYHFLALPLVACLSLPLLGGSFAGLPMTVTGLASMPRRWWDLFCSMLVLTGLKWLAGVPLIALLAAAFAYDFGIDGLSAVLVGAIALALASPSLIAIQLNLRSPTSVADIDLGNGWLNAAQFVFILFFASTALALMAASLTIDEGGGWAWTATLGLLAWWAVLHTLYTWMMSVAHRRYIDVLIPPDPS